MPTNADRRNLQKLARSLQRRQQRARQVKGQGPAAADELWRVWEDAAQFRATAEEFWPAGRDGAIVLLTDGCRAEGQQRLRQLLATLCALGLHSPAASCFGRAAEALADRELLEHLRDLGTPPTMVRLLPEDVRKRLTECARAAYSDQPTPEAAQLLGRLLDRSAASAANDAAEEAEALRERSLEARALRFARSQGTETAAGIAYEAQYALWRMLTEDDIDCLGLQDLEDIKVVHCSADGSRVTEHVQAKKRDDGWTVPDLQARGEGANRVFDSFAEVTLAEPEARLTFATDSGLTRGAAPNLLRAAAKFREISPDPAELDSAALAQISLTADEQRALDQLRERMRPDLLDRIDLPHLLARVVFDTGRTRRELRSELIRRISARLGVADPEAEDTYRAFIGLLLEQMEERKEFSRAEIEALIARAGVQARAFRDLAVTGTRVEMLDFARVGEASAARYYQGVSAAPADIAAGLDALRPGTLAAIRRELAERRCCIIRAPSGQGKTTLLYRYAYESADDMLLLRVHGLDRTAMAEITRLTEPLDGVPVLVLVDNLAARDRDEWPDALRRLLERPNVRVLATSREDDWRLASASALEDLVGFVYPRLDEHTAEVVFEGLGALDGLRLHAEHWREPFEQAGGLLMEYVHLLTQGRRMRDVLADQIAGLERRLAHNGPMVLGALRYIATAHRYGGYLSRATLARLVPTPVFGIGQTLRVLEDEFWIRDTADGRYTGLHQVRSRVVSDLLHEYDPLAETVERLLQEADADEVGAMLEDLLYSGSEADPRTLTLLAERASREGPRFGLRVATAAYGAEERRHADAAFGVLDRLGVTGPQALLATWATLPRPIDVSSFVSVLPEAAQSHARKILAALPRRRFDGRAETRFLRAVGPEQLGAWLAREASADDFTDLVQLLAIVAPELGHAALEGAGIDAITNRIRQAEPSRMPEMLAAVREVDVPFAIRVTDHLGPQFALERAVTTVDGCYAVQVDGATVRAQFLASLKDGDEPANDAAVRITRALYGLFPGATASDVSGYVDPGTLHPDAQKHIPRENMPPSPFQVMLNQFWLSLISDRLGARSLVSVARLHDAYAHLLLVALEAAYRYLDQPTQSNRRAALDAWERVRQSGSMIPYTPHRTGSLLSMPATGATDHSHPGSQPLDREFGGLSGAAFNATRELMRYITGEKHNNAILSDQLARIHRQALAYGDLRLALRLDEADDGRWRVAAPAEAARLREAIGMVAAPRASRPHRAEARRLYEAFAEVRAVAGDLFEESQRTVDGVSGFPNGGERLGALRELVGRLASQLRGWEALGLLGEALAGLARLIPPTGTETCEGGPTESESIASTLAQLDAVTPLDLELWLASRDADTRLAHVQQEVRARLAARMIDATCTVLPPSLQEPLVSSALVVVRPADLRRVEQIRDAVRAEAFAVLPAEVSHLVLLLGQEDGAVLPGGFQTWRLSGEIPSPYSAILGLGPWSPAPDAESFAGRFALTVDRREHPVAERIDAAREQFAELLFAFGHLTSVLVAASSPGWTFGVGILARQIDAVTEHVQHLVERMKELGASSEQHPDWEPVTVLVLDALGAYLDWLMRAVRDQAERGQLPALKEQLDAAWVSSHNLLYLGRDTATCSDLSADVAVGRIQCALDEFVTWRRALVDGLMSVVGDEPQTSAG